MGSQHLTRAKQVRGWLQTQNARIWAANLKRTRPVPGPLVQSFSLPPELLLEIFKHSDFRELKQLSLLCRDLRAMTIALLFRDLHFTASPPLGRLDVEAVAARLEFYSSEDIAPLVRECKLQLYNDSGGHGFIDMVFELLPKFPNLYDLTFHSAIFTARRLESFGKLKTLTSLHISHCSVSPNCPVPQLPLKRLKVSYHRAADYLPVRLQPDNLEHFVVYFSQLPASAALPMLPKLRVLVLGPSRYGTDPNLSGFVARCHSMEKLHLDGGEYDLTTDAIGARPVPLRCYTGPLNNVLFVARSGLLRHVKLWHDYDTASLVATLVRLAELAPELEMLAFRPRLLTGPVLSVACRFPALRRLLVFHKGESRLSRGELVRHLIEMPLPSNTLEILLFVSMTLKDASAESAQRDHEALDQWASGFSALRHASLKTPTFTWKRNTDMGSEDDLLCQFRCSLVNVCTWFPQRKIRSHSAEGLLSFWWILQAKDHQGNSMTLRCVKGFERWHVASYVTQELHYLCVGVLHTAEIPE